MLEGHSISRLAFSLSFAAVFILGCQTVQRPVTATSGTGAEGWEEKKIEEKPEPAELSEFPDIPLPEGFTIVSKESFTATSEKYKIAHLKFTGPASVYQAVNFYRDQMPMRGWKLEYVMGIETKILDFTKEDTKAKCRVLIRPASSRKTEIVIDLR